MVPNISTEYRPLEESEIGEAADVFVTTVTDLAERNGLPRPSYTRASVEPSYGHLQRTGIFRVAAVDGRIASICAAIVRDDLWFLAMFWTLPSFQKQKIGKPLLEQVWREGRARGAKIGFTWSSIDFTAMATYMRLGMLPGGPILTFSGAPSKSPIPPTSHRLEPLDPRTAPRLDALVRGTPREVDHAFWRDGGSSAYEVHAGDQTVGYFYVRGGAIGPAAWTSPEHGRPVIDLALGVAIAQSSTVRIMCAGDNKTAIVTALEYQLKLVGSSHLLRSAPFGRLDQYLPWGPALF